MESKSISIDRYQEPGANIHTCSPSTLEAKVGVQEVKASLDSTVRSCHKTREQANPKNDMTIHAGILRNLHDKLIGKVKEDHKMKSK